MHQTKYNVILILFTLLVTACYNNGPQTPDAWNLTEQQIDSISFSTTHHYSQNYNFVVTASTLPISDEAGEMAFDTLYIMRGDAIVVADIITIPTDTIDSVWVKVARDQMTQGWIRESEMLGSVSPDDPISQFIDFFSDIHLLIFLAITVIVGGLYGVRILLRRKAFIVHFNDIDSFYPTLLCILMAGAATLYASIQMFGAESWRHFYYHPSLNPLSLPFYLGAFVASVWAIIIVAVATVDDVLRLLSPSESFLYLAGLTMICALDYVIFSVLTLYYIGYVMLVAYVVFSIWNFLHYTHRPYICGICGKNIRQKGICPHCGALNT